MKIINTSSLWQKINHEANQIAQDEPYLADFINSTILQHESLNDSLCYILANKLTCQVMPFTTLQQIINHAYQLEDSLIQYAINDINAIYTRDPAVTHYITPLLYLKGFHALQAQRITHFLWKNNRHALAIFLQNQISVTLGVDIHPAAIMGSGIMLDHATGIVIGETAVVEDNVSILQNVTLGGTGKDEGDRHPKIREGVMIGAGAKILGNIEIGKNAKIGAGSVVLQAVPANMTAAGIPAKLKSICSTKNPPSVEMDQSF